MIDVKAGDTVVISRRGIDESIAVVDRATSKHFILSGSAQKWRQGIGCPVGAGAWDLVYARKVTEEEAKAVRLEFARQKLARKIASCDFSKLELAQLRSIESIIGGGQ